MPPSRLIPRPAAPLPSTRTKQHKAVSTAGILKRKPMVALSSHRAPHRQRREKAVHPLVRDYQDDMAHCLAAAELRAIASLSAAHTELLSRVEVIKDSNTTTLSTLHTQSEALLAPLHDTEVSVSTAAAATATTTTIGEQIETFRADLLRGEKELERLWGLWDEAQKEIEELGGEKEGDVRRGWEEEVRERIAEMEREVAEAGQEAVRAMGEAEKEINRKLREDQAKLVAMMFGEE